MMPLDLIRQRIVESLADDCPKRMAFEQVLNCQDSLVAHMHRAAVSLEEFFCGLVDQVEG
jgi:hypothetical protein